MPTTRLTRTAVALTAGLLATVTLTACGGEDGAGEGAGTSSAAPSATVVPALAAKVPGTIKADGKITVGTDATYAPSEFLAEDGKTVKGFDVDLFNAVAARLGLTVEWQPSSFDAIIPGVTSGKYEAGVSSFTINPERLKAVQMVSYFTAGTQWVTRKGNPAGVSPDDPCGKRIGVQKGTVQVDDITAKAKKCKDAGKPEITIDQYQGQDQVTAAVVSGKEDAMLADSPISAYAVRLTNGQLELLGDIYDSAPYGYVVGRDQTELAEAITGAVKAVIADGTYQKVLATWGVDDGAVAESAVSLATS